MAAIKLDERILDDESSALLFLGAQNPAGRSRRGRWTDARRWRRCCPADDCGSVDNSQRSRPAPGLLDGDPQGLKARR
jgi:hypothetical protein